MTDDTRALEDIILTRLMRLNAAIHGVVAGLVAGFGVFIATNWLILKGGPIGPSGEPVIGPHLWLLSHYFIGYKVSFVGSLIGFAYAFAGGFLVGFFIAKFYNWIVDSTVRPVVRQIDSLHVPILMYHALGEEVSAITIPTAVFAWQMRWLHERGYRAVALSELVRHIRDETPLPDRAVAITFDDGFESVYTHACPILAEYGFCATVFLVSDYCGRRNDWPGQPSAVEHRPLMTWSQVQELDRHGIEFGAHSISHPFLDRLAPAAAEREILSAKTDIESHLGHAVTLFAYPYGRYNAIIKAVVGRAYTGACTTRPGIVKSASDPLALERIEALYVAHPLLFQGMDRPWFPTYLGMRRLLRTGASAVLRRPWN